jgi:FemAB-related protein (PEP-CTERM system-associated)
MNALTAIAMPPAASIDAAASDADIAAFVALCDDATAFHSIAWCRAVTRATRHAFHPLVARDESGAIVGYLPLHHVRSFLFGDALVSTGFAVEGGILADDDAVTAMLADAAIQLAERLGVGSIELRGGRLPEGWAVDSISKVGFARPLAADRDAELLAIPRKQRAEVRKSIDHDFAVTASRNPAERAAHYAVYATSVRNLGTPVFPKRLFDAVIEGFGDDADVLVIRDGAEPISAVLSLYWRGTVLPYWGGGIASARKSRANERLYFELMDHARERGMTAFDFGRSKAGSGPASYKHNWGFEARPLHYARWDKPGSAVRDANAESPRFAQMVARWQKLPLWLANRLGPIIARQLG